MIQDHNILGSSGFFSFFGVVEDRMDPTNMSRVRVRCYYWHTANKVLLPTNDLQWAQVMNSVSAGDGDRANLKEGTVVYGFFLDGEEMQVPMITHTLPGYFVKNGTFQQGFNDPRPEVTSTYPGLPTPNKDGITEPAIRYTLPSGDPTINKYNRGIAGYASAAKAIQRRTNIQLPQGAVFDESTDPFKAKAPYNHAHESESGHVVELDDTPGSERVHVFHRAGSFVEMHPNGKVVYKSIGDSEVITIKNRKEYVEGNEYKTVNGTQNERVAKGVDIEVSSNDYNLEVLNGNVSISTSKDISLSAGGNINITAGGSVIVNGETIELN